MYGKRLTLPSGFLLRMRPVSIFFNDRMNRIDEMVGAKRQSVRLALIAFAALFFCYAHSARAWNLEGHRTVAQVELPYLTPEAKRRIEQLFGEPAEVALAANASWADSITTVRPETRPWHYVNIPRRADGFDRYRDCPDGACVVGAIEQQLIRLRDRDLDISQRREALKFIVHFVGDLHQPLHCGDGSDRGGNDTMVEFDGMRSNLHRVWDGEFFSGWQSIPVTPHPLRDEQTWHGDSVMHWANESHRIAVEEIYSRLPKARADRTIVLRAEDMQRFWIMAQQQMARAGRRLAALLNANL